MSTAFDGTMHSWQTYIHMGYPFELAAFQYQGNEVPSDPGHRSVFRWYDVVKARKLTHNINSSSHSGASASDEVLRAKR